MQVILRLDDKILWLSEDVLSADEFYRIFAQYPAEGMVVGPVSERVHSLAAIEFQNVDAPLDCTHRLTSMEQVGPEEFHI